MDNVLGSSTNTALHIHLTTNRARLTVHPEFLQTNLHPNLLSTLTTHSTTYYRILSTLLAFRSTITRTIDPLLTRLLHSPDIPSFLLLLVLLFVSVKAVGLL